MKFGSKRLKIKLLNTIARFLYENELLLFGDSIKSPDVILERSLSMTDTIPVNHVRYVKLGKKEDNWEEICFKKGWIPLGYPEMEKKIGREYEETKLDDLEKEYKRLGYDQKKITTYFNQIKQFYTLGEDTVWVMFRASKLYWGTASKEVYEFTEKDLEGTNIKKPFLYRKIKPRIEGTTWLCHSLENDFLKFDIEKIDGIISKTSNARISICPFKRRYDSDKINNYISNLIHGKFTPCDTMTEEELIKSLSPTNFEWFVSNIYCQLGYLNLVEVGGSTQKNTDLILLSPTNDRVLVQIKTSANQAVFDKYAEIFEGEEDARFIYHTPEKGTIKQGKKRLKPKHIDDLLNEVKKEDRSILLEWLKLKCYFGTVESAKA